LLSRQWQPEQIREVLVSPPSPEALEQAKEQGYEMQLRPLFERLQRGEEVELMQPGSGTLPPFRIRCGEGHTRVRPADNGVAVESPTLGLVEFFPPVPLKRYRIIADMQHTRAWVWQQGMGGTGLSFTGRHVPSQAGKHH